VRTSHNGAGGDDDRGVVPVLSQRAAARYKILAQEKNICTWPSTLAASSGIGREVEREVER